MGRIAFTYNIPVTALAGLIGVCPATVYRWFYGEAEPREGNVPQIAKVLRVLKHARDAGALPLQGTEAQRTAELREILLKHRPSKPAEVN